MEERKLEINNKLESIELIRELGLNKFSEELFGRGDEEKVIKFLENNPAKYYAIRDKSVAGGIFKLKVLKDDVLNSIKEYEFYTINVSSANYSNSQLLVGEIEIFKTGEVYLTLSTNKEYSVRDAIRDPEFNLKTDLFDDENLKRIPYFDLIFEFIVKNRLYDVIVEFSLFNENVGINNENIIIYELRTNY